jgi:hypothetical protein
VCQQQAAKLWVCFCVCKKLGIAFGSVSIAELAHDMPRLRIAVNSRQFAMDILPGHHRQCCRCSSLHQAWCGLHQLHQAPAHALLLPTLLLQRQLQQSIAQLKSQQRHSHVMGHLLNRRSALTPSCIIPHKDLADCNSCTADGL